MAKEIDYSVVLSDIGPGVAADNRQLLEAQEAAKANVQAQLKAHEAAAATKISGMKNALGLFQTGMQAYEFKKGEDLKADIQGVLKNTEYERGQDFRRSLKGLSDEEKLAMMEGQEGSAIRAEFNQRAMQLRAGYESGAFGREEAMTRIQDLVKSYSADHPMFSSTFRKVAANLTGVSNVDIYGIHQWLTTKSAGEKQAEEMSKANLALLKDAAEYWGFTSLEEIQARPDLIAARKFQIANNRELEALKNVREQRNLSQEERDHNAQATGTRLMASTLPNLRKELMKLEGAAAASGSMEGSNALNRQRAKMQGFIASERARILEEVAQLRTSRTGESVSATAYKNIVDEVNSTFKTYEDMVNTVGGAELFKKMVENKNLSVENTIANFKILTPHFEILKQANMLPQMTPIFFTSSPEVFKERFGSKAYDTMVKIVNNGNMGALTQAIKDTANGDRTAASFKNLDPDVQKATLLEVDTQLDDPSFEGEGFANAATLYFQIATPGRIGARWEEAIDKKLHPDSVFMQKMSKLPEDVRRKVVSDIHATQKVKVEAGTYDLKSYFANQVKPALARANKYARMGTAFSQWGTPNLHTEAPLFSIGDKSEPSGSQEKAAEASRKFAEAAASARLIYVDNKWTVATKDKPDGGAEKEYGFLGDILKEQDFRAISGRIAKYDRWGTALGNLLDYQHAE